MQFVEGHSTASQLLANFGPPIISSLIHVEEGVSSGLPCVFTVSCLINKRVCPVNITTKENLYFLEYNSKVLQVGANLQGVPAGLGPGLG